MLLFYRYFHYFCRKYIHSLVYEYYYTDQWLLIDMKDMILKSLDVALLNSLPIRIIYDGKEGITERTVLVKSIKENNMVAYCRLRRRISSFKIDRILAAEVVYGETM